MPYCSVGNLVVSCFKAPSVACLLQGKRFFLRDRLPSGGGRRQRWPRKTEETKRKEAKDRVYKGARAFWKPFFVLKQLQTTGDRVRKKTRVP